MARRYMTILGRSCWALVNAYYAAVRQKGYLPETVAIFAEAGMAQELETVSDAIATISEKYGGTTEVTNLTVREGDFIEAGKTIFSMIRSWKDAGDEVAVDITSGRKALVVGAITPLCRIEVDHIFYLQIDEIEGASKPFMMIPLGRQKLRDFAEEARGHRE
ncbi:MAG: hypothetical protein QFX35_03480 [Candidatus Verstraetearchaeota archaeon]|nr:hypothetical protein [Candidatus Verstraetearchaeota archaeon]